MTVFISACRVCCIWNKLLPRVSMVTLVANRRQSNMSSKFPGYRTVYKLKYGRAASAVNFMKFYATVLSTVSVPSIVALKMFDIVSMEIAYTIGTCEALIMIPLYAVGFLCHKLMVFVYLSEDNQNVKISYVNFWGKRVDIDTDVTDICPISDLPSTRKDSLFLTIRRYSTSDTLKLNMPLGTIIDVEKFKTVFGDPSR